MCTLPSQTPYLSLPTSFPLASISLFCKSGSLSVFQIHLYHFFVDSTYKGCHMVFFHLCLTYFTHYDNLIVHPCCHKWNYFILSNDCVVFLCIYVPHCLYPFLCQWTFRLLPCLGYCILDDQEAYENMFSVVNY